MTAATHAPGSRALEAHPQRVSTVKGIAPSPRIQEGEGHDDMRPNECRWVDQHLYTGDVLEAYPSWPAPALIMSDGAYGLGGFPGDPRTPDGLVDWYREHVETWSKLAQPTTTLWFWNTEIGWATVRPLLTEHGWEHVETIVWDKGIGHIAGNVNGDTIRRFPVVSEICAFYRRRLEFPTTDGVKPAREWLRYEWQRAGLTFNKANEACGVKNAATRKYLTQDGRWYFPPPEMMERLVGYANRHGRPDGRPYFSLDGAVPVTSQEWAELRYVWTHQHALTNVWARPPLSGVERYRGSGKKALHLNQKPLEFMRRILSACTQPGDVVWEPFGGLCSASVAAVELGRVPFAAERISEFRLQAVERLLASVMERALEKSWLEERDEPGQSASKRTLYPLREPVAA